MEFILIIIHKICSAHISTLLGAQGANPETPGQAPFSFTISALGSFTCITQHTGPTALRPIRRTKQLWLSVLLKDTSAATVLGRDSNPHSDNTRTWVQCTRPLGHDTILHSSPSINTGRIELTPLVFHPSFCRVRLPLLHVGSDEWPSRATKNDTTCLTCGRSVIWQN